MIDLKKPHLTPQHDYVSHLVYAAKGSDVCMTIINGKPLMIENDYYSLNKTDVLDKAQTCAKDLTNSL